MLLIDFGEDVLSGSCKEDTKLDSSSQNKNTANVGPLPSKTEWIIYENSPVRKEYCTSYTVYIV